MAEINKIRFLFFVSFMIFPAHALDVIFSCANEDFKQKSEIISFIMNGEKIYGGTSNHLTYQPKPDTYKVIVYIIDKSRFVEIIRNAVRVARLEIVQYLSEWHCELVFLGIDNFDDDEYNLIGAFIFNKIQPLLNPTYYKIETIGENCFDRFYGFMDVNFSKYQEYAQICGGSLEARLRSIQHGAIRPIGSNDKVIKLYGFIPHVGEVSWPVSVVNGTYIPEVDVNVPKYNFKIRHEINKICLLILSGKEYLAVTSNARKRMEVMEMAAAIQGEMIINNEGFFILGVFNFDWTEIDIVTQIILKHSEGWQGSDYNVFTYGYGMFNTVYLNMDTDDGRLIFQQPQSNVSELIKVLMGEEVIERFIIICYFDDDWDFLEMPITLANGQYLPASNVADYTFPWVNQRIAFIVYDPIETNDEIDYSMMTQTVTELKRSGIYVVLINAFNFMSDDVYIIAQWIDCHRKLIINPEQIAVLGAGIFDTIFQSKLTTYQTSFNMMKNELKNIRNAFVAKGNEKRVFAALIEKSDDPKFEVWTYPMNTVVNGFYELDLIPDKNMFDTTGKKGVLFIITSADRFHQVAAMKDVGPLTSVFRQEIYRNYRYDKWSVFLVGLHNFEERDYHLFAELVEKQTNYGVSLGHSVCTFSYDIGSPVYQYKDNMPFPDSWNSYIQPTVAYFFEKISRRSDGPPTS